MTKKIFLAIAFVASVLVSCTDDYKDWADPQSVAQPETVSFGDGSISTVGVIDFNSVTDEMVKVCNITAPTSSDASYTPSYTITLGDQTYEITGEGYMSAEDLQNYVIQMYGRRPVERAVEATVSMWLSNNTTTVKTATSGVFNITVIPKAPQISENYYIVGGPNDWAGSAASKELKFSHSGLDVYEDPVFTIIFNASEGDTWFAIGDDEACDAIANNNDWSKLFGTTKGNGNTDPTGTLDRRSNLSDDGSFCVPGGSRLIKVTINMMDYSYQIETLNIADNYYLIGGTNDWEASAVNKMVKFSHSDKSVFDDPVFSVVFEAGEGDTWFAFGDDEACEAIGNGDWSKLFGTTKGNGNSDPTGSFDRRTNLSDDGSFKVPAGSGKYIRMEINMMTYTYTITPLNFGEYIYVPGNGQGWSPEKAAALHCPNFDGVYTGYTWLDGDFKFTKKRDWSEEYNWNDFSSVPDVISQGDGTNLKCATPGVYYMTVDVANGTISAVKVEKMGIIGDFNSWSGDVLMTWNANDLCYEVTGASVNSNGWKFRVNSDWGINLGSNDTVEPSSIINDLVANGKNIGVAGNTIKLYPCRNNSDKIYCTVE